MSKELEYIQRQIDIVKQQVKGSKVKFIVTDTVTKHQYDYYERELQTLESIEQALQRLEAIDNSNPSEALKCLESIEDVLWDDDFHYQRHSKLLDTIEQSLIKAEKEHNSINLLMQELDCKDFAELRKYARCGYEKLNKNYLKWEDLEFEEDGQETLVLLNGTKYRMYYYKGYDERITLFTEDESVIHMFEGGYPHDKQLFNDLHLERVEE